MSRSVIARRAVELFFPQRPLLKLDSHGYSAAVLNKIVAAAAEVKSYKVAAKMLEVIGEISISSRHVNRLTEEIGQEMQHRRDQQTEDYLHHRRPEVTAPAPQIAVLAADGGRIQTRSPHRGPGVHEQAWKEDKVACLLTLQGETFEEDPHPQPPRCFLDAPKVDEMVRDIQKQHGPRQENELPLLEELGLTKPTAGLTDEAPCLEEPAPAAGDEAQEVAKAAWPPQRTKESVRSCVATLQTSKVFAKMVASEAWRRNFQAAQRGAFLGDGSAWIWKMHRQWFKAMTPITDFVHALTYLYVSASVLTDSVSLRWQCYVEWMTQCWQGKVALVIEDLQKRLQALGPYPGQGKPPDTDPRQVLLTTLRYLENNQKRMSYAEYRKQGLPVTSTRVESLIKEVNYRVKGTEKFWDRPEGAEAILQVRAAVLSDDDRLALHIQARPGCATRRYNRRGAA